jgi:hypothetical protein
MLSIWFHTSVDYTEKGKRKKAVILRALAY